MEGGEKTQEKKRQKKGRGKKLNPLRARRI